MSTLKDRTRGVLDVVIAGCLLVAGLWSTAAAPARAQTAANAPTPKGVTVTIDEIVPNKTITGRVKGLTADETSDYKIVVYVHTDRWYIHPFERGGDGYSFGSINSDGSWQISTVKRQFLADRVAVLVVPAKEEVPSQVADLSEVTSIASFRQAGDGKL